MWFRNLAVSKKIFLLIFTIVLLAIGGVAAFSFFMIGENIERLLGQRLEAIARTGALLISGDEHERVSQSYRMEDKELTKKEPFLKIQKQLRGLQKVNNLSSDVYTLVKPDWRPDQMIFVTMANEKTYVGNGLPAHPQFLRTLETGLPTHTKLYQDAEGYWVSAFAAIRDQNDSIVAALEIDYNANHEVVSLIF